MISSTSLLRRRYIHGAIFFASANAALLFLSGLGWYMAGTLPSSSDEALGLVMLVYPFYTLIVAALNIVPSIVTQVTLGAECRHPSHLFDCAIGGIATGLFEGNEFYSSLMTLITRAHNTDLSVFFLVLSAVFGPLLAYVFMTARHRFGNEHACN